MSFSTSDATRTAFPMLDFMLNIQRIGLQAMSLYQPMALGALLSRQAPERGTYMPFQSPASAKPRQVDNEARERVLAVGEEVLNVGTRMVPGKTTRVRRIVVQTPVEQEVTLHSETVVLERRKPIGIVDGNVPTEVTTEMSDSSEVPVVSKGVRLVEEVLLRKEVTARTETIRETLKRDKLEIEQPSQLPVLFDPARKREQVSADARDKSEHDAPSQRAGAAADSRQEPATEHKPAPTTVHKPVPEVDQKHGTPPSTKR
jgi:stress response protein YsnF